jgi:outer membrane protein OmpA-like peptidoglycan-associated protein
LQNFKRGFSGTTGDFRPMNKITRAFSILVVFLLICPALGQADIVYIKNGDKLFGTIQSPSFTVQAPYGKVSIKNEFLKSINYNDGSVGRWTIETINNDRFSGSLLNDSIQFIQEDGKHRKLSREQIQRIKREISGPSHSITTTIFTMKNNDRFSGKFLNAGLEIRANYITKSIQPGEINRIEFTEEYQAGTTILLENGDLISGTLKQNQIRLTPDAVSEFTVAKSSLKSIQFNAPKMVLKNFSGKTRSDRDSDGDGIPDYADICMNTPGGVRVGQDGCARKTKIADANPAKKERHQKIGRVDSQTGPAREIQNILFDFNRSDLKPQYYSVLNEIALMLSQRPDTNVDIKGHTDNVGTAEYNQTLSEKRAGIVKNYFVQKGIEKDRLFPKGYGFTMNNASNEDESGRALNRRVEMLLIADQKTLAYQR